MAKKKKPYKGSISPSDRARFEYIYGPIKGLYHPHQVAEYEDALQAKPFVGLGPEGRFTCSKCRTFAPTEHIVAHAENPDLPSIQSERARTRVSKKNGGAQWDGPDLFGNTDAS